jgi:hypothetical protein
VRVQDEPLRVVLPSQDLHGIAEHLGRRRDLGQNPAVRAPEAKLAVRLSIDLVGLLMDGAMVSATEQGEIRQRGGAALRPVSDVVPLAEPNPAAREAAAAIPMVQRPP